MGKWLMKVFQGEEITRVKKILGCIQSSGIKEQDAGKQLKGKVLGNKIG